MKTTTNEERPSAAPRVVTLASWMILVFGFFWLLVAGKTLLIPLALAFLAVYMIEVIKRKVLRIRVVGHSVPAPLAQPIAIVIMLAALWAGVSIVADNASRVAETAPRYGARAEALLNEVGANVPDWFPRTGTSDDNSSSDTNRLGPAPGDGVGPAKGGTPAGLDRLFESIDIGSAIGTVAYGVSGLLGYASMVLVFMFFLLLERKFLEPKLIGLVPDAKRRDHVTEIIEEIDRDIRVYLGVKTFVSALTAVGSYVVMRWVGLDFPEFFALLIFLFNFIPNLGSLVATLVPTLLALLQFESYRPFLTVGVGITTVQLIVANLIEPHLMGKSLNISPLVVILSLVFWGLVWGVPGMFLCVPLTVIGMIVLSKNPATRWVAVLLSLDGKPKCASTAASRPAGD